MSATLLQRQEPPLVGRRSNANNTNLGGSANPAKDWQHPELSPEAASLEAPARLPLPIF